MTSAVVSPIALDLWKTNDTWLSTHPEPSNLATVTNKVESFMNRQAPGSRSITSSWASVAASSASLLPRRMILVTSGDTTVPSHQNPLLSFDNGGLTEVRGAASVEAF